MGADVEQHQRAGGSEKRCTPLHTWNYEMETFSIRKAITKMEELTLMELVERLPLEQKLF